MDSTRAPRPRRTTVGKTAPRRLGETRVPAWTARTAMTTRDSWTPLIRLPAAPEVSVLRGAHDDRLILDLRRYAGNQGVHHSALVDSTRKWIGAGTGRPVRNDTYSKSGSRRLNYLGIHPTQVRVWPARPAGRLPREGAGCPGAVGRPPGLVPGLRSRAALFRSPSLALPPAGWKRSGGCWAPCRQRAE